VDRLAHGRARVTLRVAVVGAGWAGCACAVRLAQAGCNVTLYEAAPSLGGRARTVVRDGLALDNGQHLLLGAYTQTIRLVAQVHEGRPALVRRPLSIAPLSKRQPDAIALRARALPAPYGFAAGLMRAEGLSWRERAGVAAALTRWRAARFRCAPDMTVDALLATMPARATRGLWAPLCVAALNTPPARASAASFLAVLEATFHAGADAADLLLPAGSLGEAFPDAAARWLAARAHCVACNTSATVDRVTAEHVNLQAGASSNRYDAVVVAVGPHQLARALGPMPDADAAIGTALSTVASYAYESITTVYLGYRGDKVTIPAGLVRLDDAPGQWLFERADIVQSAQDGAPRLDQLFAVVISTSGPHDELPQDELSRQCDLQLRRGRPTLPPLAWSRVIAERRATYACTPGLAHPPVRLARRLYLAGDYVYAAFPATLEAAVRSGTAAAAALLADDLAAQA
jgi:squalene-associated FAD-dependent desaturase